MLTAITSKIVLQVILVFVLLVLVFVVVFYQPTTIVYWLMSKFFLVTFTLTADITHRNNYTYLDESESFQYGISFPFFDDATKINGKICVRYVEIFYRLEGKMVTHIFIFTAEKIND